MRFRALVLLGFVVLAGCSGGGGTAPAPTPTPTPGPCGGTVVDTQAKLVSPPPGATGVSPSIGALTFTYGNPLTPIASFSVVSTDGTDRLAGNIGNSVTIVPGQLTLVIPPLKPATTYRVTGLTFNYAHVPCFTAVTADLGSFTTQ